MFKKNIVFSEAEKEILEYWAKHKCFEEGNVLSKERENYVFYDGPPFATGLPHYGHILSGTIKDTIGRFYYQKGFHVERRFGWDCHGLPVEYEIDKKLNITDRNQVLEMGIDKYNEECRGIVQKYTSEWESVVERMGRWVDFRNGYKTMDPSFMESVWYIFNEMFKRDKIYRGFKIMPFSTACKTPLSNFEATQNYKDVSDPSILVKFPVINKNEVVVKIKTTTIEAHANISFVAWTTTPWTLPANCGLSVNPEFDYALFYANDDRDNLYFMHKDRISAYFKKTHVIQTLKGSDLVGLEYEQPFTCFEEYRKRGFFRVFKGDFVTCDSGTAIVHCAPSFGEEDYNAFLKNELLRPDEVPPCHIDENGNFTMALENYAINGNKIDGTLLGMYIKDGDKLILSILKDKLLLNSRMVHSYPFCWRSDTPLVYKLVPNWFIKVKEIQGELLKQNEKINWVPEDIKYKRFHNWLASAKDWAVSRNRFWGTPLPIWAKYENGEYDFTNLICVGSVKELEELSGKTVSDLHRHFVDQIEFKKDGVNYRRIEEVLDCWFESGSMPYAQDALNGITEGENGYLKKINFPANFIGEGLDQTRGWFYTLHVISTTLFNAPAFKNVIVNGIVLAEDGKKMSKRLKNYPDPQLIFNKYGADALRMYLISSPVVEGEHLRFNENGVKEILKTLLIPWYNILAFNEECSTSNDKPTVLLLDDWIEIELNTFINKINKSLSEYKLNNVLPLALEFIDNLSNWYIRINRKELRTNNTYLKSIIRRFSIVMAAFTPFFSEYSYQTVCGDKKSVHHELIEINECDQSDFNLIKSVIEGIRHLREKHSLRLKRVLQGVTITFNDLSTISDLFNKYDSIIRSECNLLNINLSNTDKYTVDIKIKPNYKELSKDGKNMKNKINIISKLTKDEINEVLNGKGSIDKNEILVEHTFVDVAYASIFNYDGLQFGVVLDVTESDKVKEMSLGRDFYAFIQKLRKNLKMKVSDSVSFEICDKEVENKITSIMDKYYENEIVIGNKGENVGESEYKYEDENIKTNVKMFKE